MVYDFVKRGGEISVDGKIVRVHDFYYTCPCVRGDFFHHPKDVILVIILEDGRKIFSDGKNIIKPCSRT